MSGRSSLLAPRSSFLVPRSPLLAPRSPLLAARSSLLAALVTGGLILVIAGCSRSSFESTVSGTVTLDGKSIGPGVVVFAPLDRKGNPATGTIQPDGTYHLKTANEAGLPPGRYSASVSVVEEPIAAPGERNMVPGKQLVPEKFTDTTSSGLEYNVAPGRNTIDIDLRSK